MKRQKDLFTDRSLDMTPVGPEATVHDILKAKGRWGTAAFACRTQAEIGRRAPVDVLTGSRGGRIIATAADVAEETAALGSLVTAAGHVYSGWCMLGLPYRRPKGEKDKIWRISTDYADITVQSGTVSRDDGENSVRTFDEVIHPARSAQSLMTAVTSTSTRAAAGVSAAT